MLGYPKPGITVLGVVGWVCWRDGDCEDGANGNGILADTG